MILAELNKKIQKNQFTLAIHLTIILYNLLEFNIGPKSLKKLHIKTFLVNRNSKKEMFHQPSSSTCCHKASLKGTPSFTKHNSSKKFHKSSANENQKSCTSAGPTEKVSLKLNENVALKPSAPAEKPSNLIETAVSRKEIKKSTYQEDFCEVPQIGKIFKSDKFGNLMRIVNHNHNQSSTEILKHCGGESRLQVM